MPTIKILMEVELEIDIDYQPDDPEVGYVGGTEVEGVRLANVDDVIAQLNMKDSDEILELMTL